jgi:benzoate-CoA ligase
MSVPSPFAAPSRAGTAGPQPGQPFNFAACLLALNAGRAGRPAFIDDHGTLRYGELDERVRRCAAALLAAGVRREERVLLLMHDNSDWPVCFLGALYAGIVPVAVNTLLPADDYAYMLRHSRAQWALVSEALRPTLETAMAKGPHELKGVWVSRPGAADLSTAPLPTEPLAAVLDRVAPLAEPAGTGGDDIGFWLYSSGSTGRPKGTVHSHANPWWTAELYARPVLGLTENDVCFSAAKLFFAYGLGNGLSFPLFVGASVVLMAERPTPDAVFKRWIAHQPTVFFGDRKSVV